MSGMMKDLRDSIMVDVKDIINEKRKEFMREITMILRNDIKETLKDAMNTNKKKIKIDITPNLQPDLITQDTRNKHQELKNLTISSRRWI